MEFFFKVKFMKLERRLIVAISWGGGQDGEMLVKEYKVSVV